MVPVMEEYCVELVVAGAKGAVGEIIVGVRFVCRNPPAKLPLLKPTTPLTVEEDVVVAAAAPAATVDTPEGVVLLGNCLVIGLLMNFVDVVVGISIEFVAVGVQEIVVVAVAVES